MKFKRMITLCATLILCVSALPFSTPVAQAAGGSKLVALTFDDGPGPYTAGLLDGLKARGAKATFFMVGQNIAARPSLVRRAVNEGHQIANHSYSHPDLTTLSVEGLRSELTRTRNLLTQQGGEQTYYLRPPYGAYNATVRANAGGPVIMWSVDTLDWKHRNSDYVYGRIVNDTRDGSIVLMHDIHSTTVPAVLRAIDTLKEQGYECVTVKELLRRRGITPQNGTVYSSAPNKGINLPAADAPKTPTLKSEEVIGGLRIRLSCSTKGADIYYTTDGSAPSRNSTKYTAPFIINESARLRAVAYKDGLCGGELNKNITLSKAASPKITLSGGKAKLTPAAGTVVYYTTKNRAATARDSLYTAPVNVKKRLNIRVSGSGKADRLLSYTFTAHGDILTDVPAGAWYYNAVGEAMHRGIMKGVGKMEFAPEDGVTRGMFVTALHRLSPDAGTAFTASTFIDVPKNEWYTEAVAWAAEKGIVKGISKTEFAPDALITREQMCVMLGRYLTVYGQIPAASALKFTDTNEISAWAKKDVARLTELGLIEGMGDNRFAPKATASRAQCAKILVALDDIV